MKRFCIFIMFLTLSQFVAAQYFNGLNNLCVSYSSNTSISINWDIITDNTTDFKSYKVYVKQGNGAFQLLTEITDYTVSTHNYAFPVLDNYEFYIEAQSIDGSQVEVSDIKQVITLNLFNDIQDGVAKLSWQLFSDAINVDSVSIYKQINSSGWVLLDKVLSNSLSYNDTIKTCNAFVEYKLETISGSCSSESNVLGDVFEDKTAPDSPVLKVVTVDSSSGNITIVWFASKVDDTQGYVIRKRDIFGNFIEVDSLFNQFDTSYVYVDNNSDFGSELFEVTAYDNCGNRNALATPQQNIFLENSVLACDKIIELSWSKYINWQYGVENYEILQSVNNGPFNQVASLDSTVFTYQITSINVNDNYKFIVRAVSFNGIESLSNVSIPTIIYPKTPLGLYISSASVSEDNWSVQLNINRTPDGEYNGLKIYKENQFGNFDLLDEVDNTTLTYTDALYQEYDQVMRYYVSYIDGCDNDGDSSNIVATIFAQTNTLNDILEANVIWTKYIGTQNGVISQDIFREVNNDGSFTNIASLSSNVIIYSDDVSSYIDETNLGSFCYRVNVKEQTNNYGFSDSSWSNKVCANFEPYIWIPSGFLIGGSSETFKPVVNFISPNNYLFEVYNRWGQVVFSTRNIEEGWDGTYNGEIVQIDDFAYFVTFNTSELNRIEKRGVVTVLK